MAFSYNTVRSVSAAIALLLLLDVALNYVIIQRVPYTEIDWEAYMEQVQSVKDGQYDYQYLRGGTGPLVYPGGFVWVYALLHAVTNSGSDIRIGQYVFMGLHVALLLVVSLVYLECRKESQVGNSSSKAKNARKKQKDSEQSAEKGTSLVQHDQRASTVTPLVIALLFISRRIHSIFVLRLFNDCWAMFFLYICVWMCTRQHWFTASIFYTFALSIKMNILLFLPPFLLLLVKARGVVRAFFYVVMVFAFQVIVGLPFLLENWRTYLAGAFNFGRKFFYVWTVNWKVFLSDTLSTTLLLCHLSVLLVFLFMKWSHDVGGVFRMLKQRLLDGSTVYIAPNHIVALMFIGNFIGIVFCRSLHFQFYVWYYHTLPFLLWITPFPTIARLALLAAIEFVWNIFPSQPYTSALLQICHYIILGGLLIFPTPPSGYSLEDNKEKSQ